MRKLLYITSLLYLSTMAGMTKEPAKECGSCMETRPLFCLKNSCGHCACAPCWYARIVDKLYQHTTPLGCIFPECEKQLTPADVRLVQEEVAKMATKDPAVIENEFYEKLEKIDTNYTIGLKLPDLAGIYEKRLEVQVAKDPTKQFCSTADCTGAFTIPIDHKGMAQCEKCKKWQCFECGLQHGKEMSCKQARKKNKDAYLSLLYNKFNLKKCPKCNAQVEKTEGCYVVWCTLCRHEFCWKCLKPWSDHKKNDHFKCEAVSDDVCTFCKQKFKPTDNPFTIHNAYRSYPQHQVHPQCLLDWFEVDPTEGLLFDPLELTFPFATPTSYKPIPQPGIFPCPHCALKVHIELSPDKKKLIFQDIGSESYYDKDVVKMAPKRELLLIDEKYIVKKDLKKLLTDFSNSLRALRRR